VQRVQLRYGPRRGWVYLRDLRGDDEESVAETDTWSAIVLIDRLLVDAPGAAAAPGEARMLGAADRDRVLASVHQREIGDRIGSTIQCACGTAIDLDFSLGELVASLDEGAAPADERVTIPSGADELAAAASDEPVSALAERCGSLDAETAGALLDRIAPLVDLDLEAHCPSCGATPPVRFSIQHFVLGGLIGERRRRASEVHRLARTYGWSLGEILSMPRRRRRDYVELVERERGSL
jgi:hypothetical protein